MKRQRNSLSLLTDGLGNDYFLTLLLCGYEEQSSLSLDTIRHLIVCPCPNPFCDGGHDTTVAHGSTRQSFSFELTQANLNVFKRINWVVGVVSYQSTGTWYNDNVVNSSTSFPVPS
jgi:CDGSH-type Zn-finger protein